MRIWFCRIEKKGNTEDTEENTEFTEKGQLIQYQDDQTFIEPNTKIRKVI